MASINPSKLIASMLGVIIFIYSGVLFADPICTVGNLTGMQLDIIGSWGVDNGSGCIEVAGLQGGDTAIYGFVIETGGIIQPVALAESNDWAASESWLMQDTGVTFEEFGALISAVLLVLAVAWGYKFIGSFILNRR